MKYVSAYRRRCVMRLWPVLCAAAATAIMLPAATTRVNFNGLELSIDQDSGGLVGMAAAPTGPMLDTLPSNAGLVDLAYPTDSFAALRLASRFSRARVTKSGDSIVITWDALGASRSNMRLSGEVFANATISPAPDGRSVIWRCRIENRSKAPVRQILFPDLRGFRPFAGLEGTELRLVGTVAKPFAKPLRDPDAAPFYVGRGWMEFQPGAYGSGTNSLRWLDLGGLDGGLSVFQRKWATGDPPGLYTQRTESDPMQLRLAWEHRQNI